MKSVCPFCGTLYEIDPALIKTGRRKETMADFSAALKWRPDYAKAHGKVK